MDGTIRTERVVLLGLITLLGTTNTFASALAGLVVSAVAALMVCGVAYLLRPSDRVTVPVRWSVLAAVGFGVSWILGTLTPYVAPVPEATVNYLRIAGISPIVYYAVARDVAPREALFSWAEFGGLLLAAGAVREVFGRGTLLGILVAPDFTIPADFFAAPMGAFLVPAFVVLGVRLVHRYMARPTGAGDIEGGRS